MTSTAKTAQVHQASSVRPGPNYLVRPILATEWSLWDSFVKSSPLGTVFHTTTWLAQNELGFFIFGCFEGNCLQGGMVLEVIGENVAGHSHHSPYLGVVLPPAVGKQLTTATHHKNILSALAEHATTKFQAIECWMSPELIDLQPFIWAGYSIDVRYTYRIHLSDMESAWHNMEDKRRNDIRRAQRDGIVVDDQASLAEVLSLEEMTRTRLQIFKFRGELEYRRERALRAENLCRAFVARNKNGEALAGVYLVWDDKNAYYILGGYNPAIAHRGAGPLAIWSAMCYAEKIVGVKRFDFLGSTARPVERFFRDFGGILTPGFVARWRRPVRPSLVRRALRRLKRTLRSVLSRVDYVA